jgi:hypothetical protein
VEERSRNDSSLPPELSQLDFHLATLQAAEKLGFRVGRGFIPGINLVIFVALRPNNSRDSSKG